MIVAMREDEAFDPLGARGEGVTDQRRGDPFERAVALFQPLSAQPVVAGPFRRFGRAFETFVGMVGAHTRRRPQLPEIPLQFLDGVGCSGLSSWSRTTAWRPA